MPVDETRLPPLFHPPFDRCFTALTHATPRFRLLPTIVLTWVTLVAACWLLEGQFPPHVNESHYLCKAKHYFDDSFAAGDLFLESRDAHAVFFATFGQLTRVLSLSDAAWAGRWIVWCSITAAMIALFMAARIRPTWWITTGLACIALWQVTTMAGEWVVGGVEGKGMAFVFAILALALVLRGYWKLALIACGAATACHVLVGGWLGLVVGCGLLRDRGWRAAISPRVVSAGILSLALASIAVFPALALNAQVDSATATRAASIYVYDRLAHHLVFQRFPPVMIIRHFAAWAAFIGLWWIGRNRADLRRLGTLVWGGGVLVVVGIGMSFLGEWHPKSAAPWLRYYFFRTPDWLLPVGLALFGTHAVSDRLRGSRSWMLGLVAACTAFAALAANRSQLAKWPIPPASRQSGLVRGERGSRAVAAHREWTAVCAWVQDHTPPGSVFITPRRQQTFKWYAERGEVVNWKDVPQDASSLLEWWSRYRRVYPPHVIENGLTAHGPRQLRAIAADYGATWLIIDRRRGTGSLPWTPAYPTVVTDETRFVVFQLPSENINETEQRNN